MRLNAFIGGLLITAVLVGSAFALHRWRRAPMVKGVPKLKPLPMPKGEQKVEPATSGEVEVDKQARLEVKCPFCGNVASGDTKTCPNCGAVLI